MKDVLFQSYELLEQLDNSTMIIRMNFQAKVCLLTKKREFVVLRHCYESEKRSVVFVKSIEYENSPPVQEDSMRGTIHNGGFIIEPKEDDPNCCLVTYISHAELKLVPNIDSEFALRIVTKKILENTLKIFDRIYTLSTTNDK